MTIIEIFDKLNLITSTKDKQVFLETHKSNIFLRTLLEANLNPYKLYQFNKMPEYTNGMNVMGIPIEIQFTGLLTKLQTRAITGNKAKDEVVAVFSRMTKEESSLYEKILLKSSIGVGTSTVNKVWPKLIPEFKVMLAPSELPNLTDLQYPLYIQPKYDGYRCVYYNGKLYTRSGLEFPNVNLKTHFSTLFNLENVVLDGELYIEKTPFNELTKVLNADNAVIPINLKYFVYDCVPLQDWDKQKTSVTYTDRLKLIRQTLNDLQDYKKIIDTPTDRVESAAEAIEIYKKYLKNGYEGCMLKALEGKYQWKRCTLKSGEMIKLKPFKSEDLEIVAVVEGEGKYQGTLGSIIVKGNNVAETSVGSGFTDEDRKEIWDNKDKYIGKIAEIKYFEISEDKVLRFPIFERMRTDK